MNREEFLSELQRRLTGLPPEDIAERIGFYKEMIEDRMEEGLTEEEAIQGIGTVNSVVDQIMNEKSSSKKTTKLPAILGAILALILLSVGIYYAYSNVIKPTFRYKAACKSLENGEYAAAIDGFTALGDYKDAPVQLQEANYSLACSLLEKGNYSEAAQAFTALQDYKDAPVQLQEANYSLACSLLEKGNYSEAARAFMALQDYKNSGEQVKECNYQLALESFNNKDYEQTLKLLSICNAYKDAPRYAQISNIYILVRDHNDKLLSEAETDQLTADDLSQYSDFCLEAAKRNEEEGELVTALKLYAKCPSDVMSSFIERAEFPIVLRGFGSASDRTEGFDWDSRQITTDSGETFSFGYKIGTDGQVTFIYHQDTNKAYRTEFTFFDWSEDQTTYDFYKIGGTSMESGNQSVSYAVPYADIAKHQEVCVDFFDSPEMFTGFVFSITIYSEEVTETYELVQECMEK